MAYSKKVIDHYENPRNVDTLDDTKKNVATAIVGAPACGDVMKLQIEIDQATNTIVDAKFKTFGCGSAIASSSLITEILKGKSLEEAKQVTNQQIVDELELPPVKIHCSILAEEAVQAALENYYEKQQAN